MNAFKDVASIKLFEYAMKIFKSNPDQSVDSLGNAYSESTDLRTD